MRKILIIAYYFEPYQGVGAKRVTYWARNLKNISGEWVVDVITATKQEGIISGVRNVYFVPNTKRGLLGKVFKNDPGASWIKDLKHFFDKILKFEYDFVLITGGPFLHFNIGNYLFNKYRSKILFDFRDPFAVNPLFKRQNFVKVKIKKILERHFIKNAHKIISVNESCLDLIAGEKNIKIVIDNGYDENIAETVIVKKFIGVKKRIVYAGKLSHGRNIEEFLKVIGSSKYKDLVEFHYVGPDIFKTSSTNVFNHGVKTYGETLSFIAGCHIGLVLTGGYSFESTTKIYDYIGLGLKIFIVTDGEPNSGSISLLTKDLSSVIWAKNNQSSLDEMILNIVNLNAKQNHEHKIKYSRRRGLEKLVSLISE